MEMLVIHSLCPELEIWRDGDVTFDLSWGVSVYRALMKIENGDKLHWMFEDEVKYGYHESSRLVSQLSI